MSASQTSHPARLLPGLGICIRNFRILRCEARFRPLGSFPHHEFYGSMWRGALGEGLAALGGEAVAWRAVTHGDGNGDVRPLRILSVYPDEIFGRGPTVRVVFELFGTAADESDLFRRAWEAAGKSGFGTERCEARLESFRTLSDRRAFEVFSGPEVRGFQVTSPCSLKRHGSIVPPRPLDVAEAGFRRAAALSEVFAKPDDEAAWTTCIQAISPPYRSMLDPQMHRRHSARAGESQIRGWMGVVEFHDRPDRQLLVGLRCAEALGVGRNVAFGCGRIHLDRR